MDCVFAPSLLGPRQDSTLALHQCWADEGERTARGAGGAPPPPLMVMVAAMLRRSTLDAVRGAAPPMAVTSYYNDPQCNTQRAVILNLVAKDDVEGIEALKLAKVAPSVRPEASNYVATYLYHSLVWSVLDKAAIVAWRTKSYRGFVAAIKRLAIEYENLRCAPLVASAFHRSSRPSSDDGFSPLTKLCPPTLQEIFETCSRWKLAPACLEHLDHLLRAHYAATSAESAQLPVGDVRALLERRRDAADHSGLLSDLLLYVSRGVFTAAEAGAALVELNHGDVAAMLFAAAPDSSALHLNSVHAAARDLEFPTTLLNHATVDRYAGGAIDTVALPHGRLMKAFDGNGSPVVRPARTALDVDSSGTRHVMLSRIAAEAVAKHPGAAVPYRSRGDFERHWNWQLRGLLGDDWDWSNCIAAGGAVVRALVGPDVDTTVPEDPLVTSFGDVDLFFYGLSYADQRRRLQELERHVRARVGAGRYAVLLTSRTLTIVVEDSPRLQVVLGRWASAADVLSTCDVDCCGAGYDGREVWLTGRAAAAYATRMNVADAIGHAVRGSIQYEMRLWKYAARYGFAVLDPLHDATTAIAVLANLTKTKGGSQRSKVAAARHVATNFLGLPWLMAVDAGLLEPVDAVSDLAVGGSTTLEMVLDTVTAKGYMESDNYGTHEEGYVVPREDDDDNDTASATDDAYLNEEGYFEYDAPMQNRTFAHFIALSDVDRINVETIDLNAWRL